MRPNFPQNYRQNLAQQEVDPLQPVNLPNPPGYGTGFGGWLTSPDISQGLIGAGQAIMNSGYGGNPAAGFGGFNEGMISSQQRRIDNAVKQANTQANFAKALARGNGGGGGTTMAVIQQLQAENPNLSFADALKMYQSRLVNQGLDYQNGAVTPLAGYKPGVAAIAGAKSGASQNAQNQSDVNFNAEKSRQTELGKNATGIVTGGEQSNNILNELDTKYDALDKAGGIVNTDNSALQNIGARMGSSYIGQGFANSVGTKAQGIRNSIAAKKPLLLSSIKSATGMSSQQLNSNVELQFYAAAATDPTVDINANKEAIETIRNFIKTGSLPYHPELHKQDSADPSLNQSPAPKTQTSGIGQIGGRSSVPKSKIINPQSPAPVSYQDYFNTPQ